MIAQEETKSGHSFPQQLGGSESQTLFILQTLRPDLTIDNMQMKQSLDFSGAAPALCKLQDQGLNVQIG